MGCSVAIYRYIDEPSTLNTSLLAFAVTLVLSAHFFGLPPFFLFYAVIAFKFLFWVRKEIDLLACKFEDMLGEDNRSKCRFVYFKWTGEKYVNKLSADLQPYTTGFSCYIDV